MPLTVSRIRSTSVFIYPCFSIISEIIKLIAALKIFFRITSYNVCYTKLLRISDIILKQGYIKTEVDLILETVNGTNGLSPNQKLYFLDSQRKHKKYIDQPFEIRLLPHPLNYKSNIEDIIKKDITIIEMYKINSLDDLIRFEMFNVSYNFV